MKEKTKDCIVFGLLLAVLGGILFSAHSFLALFRTGYSGPVAEGMWLVTKRMLGW